MTFARNASLNRLERVYRMKKTLRICPDCGHYWGLTLHGDGGTRVNKGDELSANERVALLMEGSYVHYLCAGCITVRIRKEERRRFNKKLEELSAEK
jgi:predicted RNA-binding Zn-ribbon protein involved in translation (DUF1610 family)